MLRLGEGNVLRGPGDLCFQMKLGKSFWLKGCLISRHPIGRLSPPGHP